MPLFLLLLAVVALTGCDAFEYRPGTFEVRPDSAFATRIDLADVPRDTLVVSGQVEVRFSLLSKYRDVLGVRVLLDGKPIGLIERDAPIRFDARPLASGFHRLTLEALGALGTPLNPFVARLAERTWTVYHDNVPPSPLSGVQAGVENGLLRLRWTPSRALGFREYGIWQTVPGGPAILRTRLTARDAAAWTDSLYVGGTARYSVALYTGGGSAGVPVSFSGPVARIAGVEALPGGGARVRVDPSGLRVPTRVVLERRTSALSTPSYTEVAAGTDAGSLEDPGFAFGATFYYRVRTEPLHGPADVRSGHTLRSGLDSLTAGVQAPYLADVRGTTTGLVYGVIGEGQGLMLARLDPATLQPATAARYDLTGRDWALSPGGRLLVWEQARHDATPRLDELDPTTLTVVRAFGVPTWQGRRVMPTDVSITDGGRIAYAAVSWRSASTYQQEGVFVTDGAPAALVGYLPTSNTAVQLSPDGELLFHGLRIFRVTGSNLVLEPVGTRVIGSSYTVTRDRRMSADSEGRLLTLRDLTRAGQPVLRTISLPGEVDHAAFEPVGDLLGVAYRVGTTARARLLDPADGRVLADVALADPTRVYDLRFVGDLLALRIGSTMRAIRLR